MIDSGVEYDAQLAMWHAWFDWYYRQPWGQPQSIAHMAQLNGKSESQTESMHANYMAAKR